MNKPTISIIILTWNSADVLSRLLPTLSRDIEASGIPTEVLVFDNGSTDATLEVARGFEDTLDQLHVVPLGRNYGTTAPRNIGVRMARGDYIMFLDSDTQIPPGTLAGLLAACDRVPDREALGILHPRLCYPTGEFQESARRFPTVFTKLYRLLHLEQLRERDESIPEVLEGRMVTVDYAISAAWLIPREVFDRIGLLDEEIFYSPEDVEFCARCWEAGLEVWYCPDVEIIHDCQRITNRKPLSRMALSHAAGLVHYWRRHGSFLRHSEAIPRRYVSAADADASDELAGAGS